MGAQVFTVLPPKGAQVQFSILAKSNEDDKRVGPGGGLSIMKKSLWELPRALNLELE